MTTTHTKMLREALMVALRNSSLPLSTDDVAALMPWTIERREEDCRTWCQRDWPDANKYRRVVECHTAWHLVEFAHTSSQVYRHLRALEKAGRIERRRGFDGDRRVLWAVLDDVDATREIAVLEQLWGIPPNGRGGDESAAGVMSGRRQMRNSSSRSPMGERLRSLRQQRGLTIERAAAKAGITSNTLMKLETATQPNPRLSSLLNLMHAYGLQSLDALIGPPAAVRIGRND